MSQMIKYYAKKTLAENIKNKSSIESMLATMLLGFLGIVVGDAIILIESEQSVSRDHYIYPLMLFGLFIGVRVFDLVKQYHHKSLGLISEDMETSMVRGLVIDDIRRHIESGKALADHPKVVIDEENGMAITDALKKGFTVSTVPASGENHGERGVDTPTEGG